jgi:cell division septation protein DedD
MEKKTKHRILGLLVIIGLVIISLPLFQGSNELPSGTTLVKAPPFPDQSMQVIGSDPSQGAISQTEPEQGVAPNTQATKVNESAINEQPDDTITQQHTALNTPNMSEDSHTPTNTMANAASSPEQDTADADPVASKAVITEDAGTDLGDDVVQTDKPINKTNIAAKTPNKKPASVNPVDQIKVLSYHSIEAKTAHVIGVNAGNTTKVSDNELFALKNAAWVIQMGSFKNKVHALRMVNRLRSSGYPAFIQKIGTPFGDSTRVFVGPQLKKDSAHAMAKKIDNDLHLRGIVISYKPLTL